MQSTRRDRFVRAIGRTLARTHTVHRTLHEVRFPGESAKYRASRDRVLDAEIAPRGQTESRRRDASIRPIRPPSSTPLIYPEIKPIGRLLVTPVHGNVWDLGFGGSNCVKPEQGLSGSSTQRRRGLLGASAHGLRVRRRAVRRWPRLRGPRAGPDLVREGCQPRGHAAARSDGRQSAARPVELRITGQA